MIKLVLTVWYKLEAGFMCYRNGHGVMLTGALGARPKSLEEASAPPCSIF